LAKPISQRINYTKSVIFLLIATGAIVFACNTQSISSGKTSPFKNVYGNAEYVGSEACENCHGDKHLSFQHTGMGLSFDKASKKKSAADFSEAIIYDTALNLYYHSFWKGEEMYISEYRLNGMDTSHYREEKVEYIIGSGQHTNSHFWSDQGYIYQAPMTWYEQEKKWGLPPGYETNNIRFSRKIEGECMTCHNSLPTMDASSTHKYLDIPNGIGCERCHGPGSIHVDEKSKGIAVDISKEADYTIVNPKRLPWKLQIDICQRCHLQGNAVLKEGKTFADFRPGMPLSDVMQVYLPTYDNDNHPFIMASHAERFQKSKCFIQSNTTELNEYNADLNFTCINCHNPHVSVKETNVSTFNSTCKGCHSSKNDQLCSADLELRQKVNDNCVNCHMPLKGAKDIPHVSIHDHFIRIPGDETHNDLPDGRITGLKSINGGDETASTQLSAYLSYFEKFDAQDLYMKKAEEIADEINTKEYSPVVIHYWYNKQQYSEVKYIADKLDTAQVNPHFTAYQIGQSYVNELSYSSAILWYSRAIQLKSKNMEYRLARVKAFLALNQTKNAKNDLLFVLKEQNKNARGHYYYGLVLKAENKNGLALFHFQQAINLDPDYEQANKQLTLLQEQ